MMSMERRTRSKTKITMQKAAEQPRPGKVKKVKALTSKKNKVEKSKTKMESKISKTVRKTKVGTTAKKPKFAAGDPRTLLKHDFERIAPSKSPVPRGYVSVPKGDVYVTRQCRQLTAAANQILYVVYDERTNDRLGLRCPTTVFSEVSVKAGATNEIRRQAVAVKDRKDLEAARESVLRQFPSIGMSIAQEILDHGFEKRSGRVGRTGTISLDEKVALAVAAHARHNFTPYDQLLREARKKNGWDPEAKWPIRNAVQAQLLEVLRKWKKRVATGKVSEIDKNGADPSKPIKRVLKRQLDEQSMKYKKRLFEAIEPKDPKSEKVSVMSGIRAKRQKKKS